MKRRPTECSISTYQALGLAVLDCVFSLYDMGTPKNISHATNEKEWAE